MDWIAPLLLGVGIIVILLAAALAIEWMRRPLSRPVALGTAIVVPVVGVVVVALVLALSLIPRTSNGQKLLDGLKPAFAAQRVTGDRAGANLVSTIIAAEDPIVTVAGGASAEVPKLIAFVSAKTGLSSTQVLAALQTNFPHTTALLEAIPLTAVSAELPKLAAFLKPALPLMPRLVQTIDAAPTVTSGWDNVPGLAGTTDFSGNPLKTVPDVSAYFSDSVIPVLETERADYTHLTSGKIDFIGPLVLVIGLIVVAFGLLMVGWAARLPSGLPAPTPPAESDDRELAGAPV